MLRFELHNRFGRGFRQAVIIVAITAAAALPAWAQAGAAPPLRTWEYPLHILFLALGVGVFVAGIAFALKCLRQFREGMDPVPRSDGRSTPSQWIEVLLIDPKTNTYSLSSFQFAAWSFAFLISYIYLFIGYVVINGHADYAPLPDDFATMLAATSGTTIIATGIDASKGSKGSGAFHPSYADLVSNGGVFAPERFQFLVWTVVGIASYLIVTFNTPIGAITHLPAVNTGMLGLSGISGLAYLGGKLTRKAGPVIASVAEQPAAASGAKVRRLYGQQLPLDSTGVYIVRDVTGKETRIVPDATPGGMVTSISPDKAVSGFATAVDLQLPGGYKAPGQVTILNPDQQTSTANLDGNDPIQQASPPSHAAGSAQPPVSPAP